MVEIPHGNRNSDLDGLLLLLILLLLVFSSTLSGSFLRLCPRP
jgi:hypothetical protein